MSDQNGSGNSGQAGGDAAAAAAAAAAAGAAGGAQAPWYGELQDAELKSWADNKNFKAPVEVLKSYHNLEKVFGADKAGRTVVLPSKDDPAEWDPVFAKLGRPESPDKYNLDVPESADKDLVGWFKTTAHKNGLTDRQAKAFLNDYNAMTGERSTQGEQAFAQRIEQDQAALKTEWGAAYEGKMGAAKKAAQTFGFQLEEIDALEKQVGFSGVMKRFSEIGEKLGEGKFVAPDTRGAGFQAMTPAAAQQELDSLRSDKEFQSRLISGDKTTQEKWDQLHRYAYGKS